MLEGISRFCFGASYAVALVLELVQLVWPRRVQRAASVLFGTAGLVAHTLYLVIQRPPLASQYGSLLLLAWVLAVFYLYGTLHHARQAWGVFVLPLVLGLIWLTSFFPLQGQGAEAPTFLQQFAGERFWGAVHGTLILLASVGVCVGFLASVMYLVQARRLRSKQALGHGIKLLSLERLEQMNRRAVNIAFPLLTVGLMVGVALVSQREGSPFDWATLKVVGTAGLWLAFVVLLYLRYSRHLRGRPLAVGTIAAFVILLAALSATHPVVQGAAP